jgi:hypothetical protein
MRTPLMEAAAHGHNGVVRLLLEKDEGGRAQGTAYESSPCCVRKMERTANYKEMYCDLHKQEGCTPLVLAAKHGHLEVVRELLAWGRFGVFYRPGWAEELPLVLLAAWARTRRGASAVAAARASTWDRQDHPAAAGMV